MSVLIKGMEIPTSPVLFCVHPDGKVFADLEGGWREYKAIPVPPHGRLIDADALYDHMCKTHDKWRENPQKHMSINPFTDDETMVLYAPTIIPSSEDGE